MSPSLIAFERDVNLPDWAARGDGWEVESIAQRTSGSFAG